MQIQTPREPQPHGDADEWAEISSAWPKRDFRVLHQTVERIRGVRVAEIDALFDSEPAPDDAAVTAVLREAFSRAGTPENRVRVALYVYARCLDTWERSTDYERIRHVLTALKLTAADFQASDGATGELLGIVVRQAGAVDDEMAVESGVNCSCPVETGDRAERVAREMRAIRRRLGSDVDGPAKLLRDDAGRQRLYFEAVSDSAAAVEGLVDPDRPARITVEEALRKIERNEKNEALRDDVYASELRAHRLALSELAKAENRRRLYIDSADVVYVYPFALEGFDAGEVDALVSQRLSLAGFGNDIEVHPLALTDLWDRPDHAAEFGYRGVSIALPSVCGTTTARDDNELTFEAEVRLSRLGNHYVRLHSELKDATLHDLNQALRRGSRNMGEERFRNMGEERFESGGPSWIRLTDYAGSVIEAVPKAFPYRVTAVGDPRASFHVALAARKISVRRSGAEPRRARLTDLEQAIGASLLFHPIPGLATALEDWVRYRPPEIRNLLPTAGYDGELVARTANTTVLYMPYSPDWRTAGYLEMIEFVASMPPLLMLWERQATAHAERLEKRLGELKRREVDVDELHLLEAEVRKWEAEIRQDLGFFHSPALCRDRSQRDFIDALWDAAGLPLLEAELDRRLAYLSALHERVSTIAAAIAERLEGARARRIELSFQLLGTFLAVASVAEVFSWLNGGFELDHWAWTVGEIVLLLAVAAAVWVIVRIAHRRSTST